MTFLKIILIFNHRYIRNIVHEKSDSDLVYSCRLVRGILCFLGQYFYDVFSGNIGLISCSIYLCYFCRYIGLISPLPRAQLCWWFSTRKLPYRDQRRRQCAHEMIFSLPMLWLCIFFSNLSNPQQQKNIKELLGLLFRGLFVSNQQVLKVWLIFLILYWYETWKLSLFCQSALKPPKLR